MENKTLGVGRTHNGNRSNKSYKFVTEFFKKNEGSVVLAQKQSKEVYSIPTCYPSCVQKEAKQVLCGIREVLASDPNPSLSGDWPRGNTRAKYAMQGRTHVTFLDRENQRKDDSGNTARKTLCFWGWYWLVFCQWKQLLYSSDNGAKRGKKKGICKSCVCKHNKNIILGSGVRVLNTGELTILRSIWKKLARKPSTLVWDKSGDSERHHKWLEHEEDVRSIAPVRKGYKKGFFRRRLLDNFPKKTYHKRNHSETTVKLYKQSFGDSLKARTVKGRRAELATCTLTHNLNQRLKIFVMVTFQCHPVKKKFK